MWPNIVSSFTDQEDCDGWSVIRIVKNDLECRLPLSSFDTERSSYIKWLQQVSDVRNASRERGHRQAVHA